VFVVNDVFVITVFNGVQPIFGEIVKFGIGGISMQTVFVIVELPQPFETVNETVYVPGKVYVDVGFVRTGVVKVCPFPKSH
jgi:hypothetical protein